MFCLYLSKLNIISNFSINSKKKPRDNLYCQREIGYYKQQFSTLKKIINIDKVKFIIYNLQILIYLINE
jgi:hypothetical protein